MELPEHLKKQGSGYTTPEYNYEIKWNALTVGQKASLIVETFKIRRQDAMDNQKWADLTGFFQDGLKKAIKAYYDKKLHEMIEAQNNRDRQYGYYGDNN